LDAYSRDLRRHPLLSREDEHEIAVRFARTGDAALGARLITANLRLVWKIAVEYCGGGRNLTDIVQEGNVGLIHAVRKYDPHRGVKLSSYAAWWIRAYILNFILSNSRLVKIGTTRAQRRLFFRLGKERAKMESSGGVVDARQLATALDVTEKEVVDMEGRLAARETSLDSPVSRRDGPADGTVGDLLSAESRLRPDHQSEARELHELLRLRLEEFAETLSGREIEIFRRRLLSDEAATLSKIAEGFGVTRERVRQIEQRLKDRLRQHLKDSLGDAAA